ncbi:MAG: hypothetical protein EOO37_04160 [Cytophagaceae bacterium]|nr:MAG: hypothetical protein EOO37_04160 [Cytophagaceae bacterium]
MTKLYLDIDGVLLTAKHTQAAPGVDEFVKFITQHFACYWLTTHCKGDSASALRYLSSFLQPATLEQLHQAVQPTTWDTLKTEAIDVTADFYWLDDNPFQSEIAYLQARSVADRLLVINLQNPNELLSIQKALHVKSQSFAPLTSFDEHLTAQYGKPGTVAREEFEIDFKQFKSEALAKNSH